VEEVAHRVDKDAPRLAPAQRLVEPLGMQHEVLGRVLREPGAATPAEAQAEGLGVAVGAARRDLGAPGDRVPGRVGPLDPTLVAHAVSPMCLERRRCGQLPPGGPPQRPSSVPCRAEACGDCQVALSGGPRPSGPLTCGLGHEFRADHRGWPRTTRTRVVPKRRLELLLPCGKRFLRPSRLPVPPLRHMPVNDRRCGERRWYRPIGATPGSQDRAGADGLGRS
jgi:hypothetical protein